MNPERENELQKIVKVYSKERYIHKDIGRTKILLLAIDSLIRVLNSKSEEEGLDYLRELYVDAGF